MRVAYMPVSRLKAGRLRIPANRSRPIEAGRFVSHPSAIEVTADQGRMRDRYPKAKKFTCSLET
jgi:hypothetical protein